MFIKFWNWLDGKKTGISLIYNALVAYLGAKEYVGLEELVFLAVIGGVLFGVGIGHKIGKAGAKQ